MRLTQLAYPTPAGVSYLEHLTSGDAELKLGTATFEAGKRFPTEGLSCHDQDEVSFLIEGHIDVICEGQLVSVKPGDLLTIPAGQSHYVVAHADTRLVFGLLGKF